MSKGKRKRDSEAQESTMVAAGRAPSGPNTPGGNLPADVGSARKEGKGAKIIYRLADGSREWKNRLSEKKSMKDMVEKVSRHLELPSSPDIRLAHVRDGGREVEIWDEYDFRALRDRALDSGRKDNILVKVYPPGGPSRRKSPTPITPSVVRPATADSPVPSGSSTKKAKGKKPKSSLGKEPTVPASSPAPAAGVETEILEVPKSAKKRKGKEKASMPGTMGDNVGALGSAATVKSQPVLLPGVSDVLETAGESVQRRKKKKSKQLDSAEPVSVPITPIAVEPPLIVSQTYVPDRPSASHLPPSAMKSATATKEKKAQKRVSLAVPPLDSSPEETSQTPHTASSPTKQLLQTPNPLRPRVYSPSLPSELQGLPEGEELPAGFNEVSPTNTFTSNSKEKNVDANATHTATPSIVPEEQLAPSATKTQAEKPKKPKKKKVSVPEEELDVQTEPPAEATPAAESDIIIPSTPADEAPPKAKRKSKKRARSPSPSSVESINEEFAGPEVIPDSLEASEPAARPKKKAKKIQDLPAADPPVEHRAREISTSKATPLDLPPLVQPPQPTSTTSKSRTKKTPREAKSFLTPEAPAVDPSTAGPTEEVDDAPVKASKATQKRPKKVDERSPLISIIPGISSTKLHSTIPPPESAGSSLHPFRFNLSYAYPLGPRPPESDLYDSSAFSLALGSEVISDRKKLKKRLVKRKHGWTPMEGVEVDKQGQLKFKLAEWVDSDEEEVEERVTEFGIVLETVNKRREFSVSANEEMDEPAEKSKSKAKSARKVKKTDQEQAGETAKSSKKSKILKMPKSPAHIWADSSEDEEEVAPVAEPPAKASRKSKAASKKGKALEKEIAVELSESEPDSPVPAKRQPKARGKKAPTATPAEPPSELPALGSNDSDPAQIPSTRFKPLPRSPFCVVCFEPTNHSPSNCPIVKSGVSALESTAVERRKLAKSKNEEDKQSAKSSFEVIETWIDKLHRMEAIRKKVTGESSSAPPHPSTATGKSTTASPEVATKSSARRKAPKLASPVKSPEKSHRANLLVEPTSRESSETRQVEQAVSPCVSASIAKSPTGQQELHPPWIPRPPSLMRIASEGRNGSVSGMSASSVAIESDSASEESGDSDGEEGAGGVESEEEGDSVDSEEESVQDSSKGDNQSESEDGSKTASTPDSRSQSSEEEEMSAIQNPDDLLHHFLTAPLSKKDQRAARKSMEGMKRVSQVTNDADDSDRSEHESEASDAEEGGPRPSWEKPGRAASHDSSIGDFEDGQIAPLEGEEIEQDGDGERSDDEEDEDNALGMRGMKVPPSLSTEHTDTTVLFPSSSNPAKPEDDRESSGSSEEEESDEEQEPNAEEEAGSESESAAGMGQIPEQLQAPSSSLDAPPSSLRRDKKSFADRNRDAESISVNGLDGAIALEEARREEAAPERAAFSLSPTIIKVPETLGGGLPPTQMNGVAAKVVAASPKNRKDRRKAAQFSSSQPAPTPHANGLAPSPKIKSKSSSQPVKSSSQINGESHAPHVSETDEPALVVSPRRTRAASASRDILKTPPPSTAARLQSQKTPKATPKSTSKATPKASQQALTPKANGDIAEPSTPKARTTRSSKINLLSQEESSHPVESDEVEYVSQDDPAYVPITVPSPAPHRSTRQTSAAASLPPPSPAPAPPQSPAPTPRRSARTRTSATPVPPSSPESLQATPRPATRSVTANGPTATPLFMSQSQPPATQAFKAVPSTPPPSSDGLANGKPSSRRGAKAPVKVSSSIAEEDEVASAASSEASAAQPQPNGHTAARRARRHSESLASSLDASTAISGLPLPLRLPIHNTRARTSMPSSSFQPLSSLDKDSLRRGTMSSQNNAKMPSASAPPRTRAAAAAEDESSGSDSSDEENAPPNPALRGRYAGSKIARKRVDRGVIGW